MKETKFPSNKYRVAEEQRALVIFSFTSQKGYGKKALVTKGLNQETIKKKKKKIGNLLRIFERKTKFSGK